MANIARQQEELEAIDSMYPDEIFCDSQETPVSFNFHDFTFILGIGYPSCERIKVSRNGRSCPEIDAFIETLPLDTEILAEVLQFTSENFDAEPPPVAGVDFDELLAHNEVFERCGDSLVCTPTDGGRGVTIERGGTHGILVSCDGVDAHDVNEFLCLTIPGCKMEDLALRILEWARANSDEGFDSEEDEMDVEGFDLQYLPTLQNVKDRKLRILTWGRDMLKQMPAEAQSNFNATVLTGKGGGINLRKMNGLSVEIQARVSRCSLFPLWVSQVVNKIEMGNLTCIAINCRKGRHRSVAAAEILKKIYYPSATTTHLTIY